MALYDLMLKATTYRHDLRGCVKFQLSLDQPQRTGCSAAYRAATPNLSSAKDAPKLSDHAKHFRYA